jgi:protocatechuate 3,4-dioxygenase beta subunit
MAMKNLLFLVVSICLHTLTGCTQNGSSTKPASTGLVGGQCEGCEAIHESPVSFEKLNNMVWLPDWNEKGSKLAINGIVYKADGKTPAPDVIIYIYHTDQTGIYPTKGDEKGWAKRHGYLRGWMKTNAKGEYKFFTLKPAPYPGGAAPAHIHVTIKEPDKNEYWIDEYLFDDDPLLTRQDRAQQKLRGGNGILKTIKGGDILKAQRDIYLGKNIENYPGL